QLFPYTTLFRSEDGGIINDPVLLRLDENHFWLSLADSDVLLWAKGLAYSLGMDVQIREADVGPVQIQAPKSLDVMVDLFGDSIREVPYYYAVHKEIEGMQVVRSEERRVGKECGAGGAAAG